MIWQAKNLNKWELDIMNYPQKQVKMFKQCLNNYVLLC